MMMFYIIDFLATFCPSMCKTTPSSKFIESFHLDVPTHVCTFIQVKQLDRFEQGIIRLGTR